CLQTRHTTCGGGRRGHGCQTDNSGGNAAESRGHRPSVSPRAQLFSRGTVGVSADGMSVPRLNELELIHGELWANLWQSSNIARIDPATGKVIAWVDLSPLTTQIAAGDTVDVANGIAYDSVTDPLFAPGKLW